METPTDLIAKLDRAYTHVCDLARGERWRMTIPAHPDDSDLIIGEALLSAREFAVGDAHPTPPPAALTPERVVDPVIDDLSFAIAQLRHAYSQLVGMDPSVQGMRSFADGLIAPQIRRLEKLAAPPPARAEAPEGAPILSGEELQDWQRIIYGDDEAARASLAYWRERKWPVDANTFPERDRVETRVYAFIDGYRAAEEASRQQIAARDQVLREHGEFGGLFQPGGRFHKVANLPLGQSAVAEGGRWLVEAYDDLKAENVALRDNNAAVKALFDEKAREVSRLTEALAQATKYEAGFRTAQEQIDGLLAERHQQAETLRIAERSIAALADERDQQAGALVTLREALEKAAKFIEYARYELQPGQRQMGDQFPRQGCADEYLAMIRAALAASAPASTPEEG